MRLDADEVADLAYLEVYFLRYYNRFLCHRESVCVKVSCKSVAVIL